MDKLAKGQKITIDPDGAVPEIQIKVGGSAIAFYEVYLVRGPQHPLICEGSSDQPVESCPLGRDASALPGQKVQWQVKTAADNDPFQIDVTLSQGRKTLASYTYKGQGDDLLVDSVTLVSI